MAIRTNWANVPAGRRPVSGPGALSGREKSDLPLIASSDWTGLVPSYPCTLASVRLTTNDIWMLYSFDVDLAVMYNKCVLTVNLFVTVIEEYSVGEGEEEGNGAMDDKIEVLPLENARGQEE